MQQDNTFQNGLQTDTDPQFQPANSYTDALHLVLTAGGHLEQERNSLVLPRRPDTPVVGGCSLNGEEILFTTDGNKGEIGTQRELNYTLFATTGAFSSHVSCTARLDYRGHRLVYFADGMQFSFIDLDAPVPTVLPMDTGSPLSEVSVASVGNSGELPTGIYQASVCLLTGSKNAAAYSTFTNVIPIVDEPLDSDRHQLDGAPPQTPSTGSITFRLTGLPVEYTYAQLVVATYIGTSNQLQLFRLPLISLAGRSSLDFTYYSFSQHQEPVELEEVLTQLAEYTSATTVLQKDGHLLAAGLKEREPLNVDWQTIANNVRLGPVIHELTFNETGPTSNDYKQPLNTTKYKGFRRKEVYSFCLVPVVAGRRLDAYHIPGVPFYHPDCFTAYYSQEEYPVTGNYEPDANGNRSIRHHRMPSIQQEPLLANVVYNSATLRVLGIREVVEPDFSSLTDEQRALLDGYYIGMQPCTGANQSILAQGIAQPLVPTDGGALMVSPFNGKYPAVQNGGFGGGHPGPAPTNPLPGAGFGYNAKGTGEYGAFYSPESNILGNALNAATSLAAVARLSGSSQLVANERENGRSDKYAHVSFNFYDNQPLTGFLIDSGLSATTQHVVEGQDDYAAELPEGNQRLYTWQQNGYNVLHTSGSFYDTQDFQEDLRYQEISNATDVIILRQANGSYKTQDQAKDADGNIFGVASRTLYNVIANRPRQYGTLEAATYYPLHFRKKGTASQPIFNGDTFITKVALQSNTAERLNSDSVGLRFRSLNYFFCESRVNAAYRHYVPVTGSQRGTLPYSPKLEQLWNGNGTGVMEYPNSLGHPTGYNRQYSAQSTLNPFFAKDTTITTVTAFPNRVAYSIQGVEGEQLDAYRIFKANDYHDIPKNYGPITDLWEWNGLYIHTSNCLWKAFFNQTATQSTSEGETYLGNGGIFPRPSIPVMNLEGGFAGCQHPKTSVSSQMGRFFLDASNRRVYLFNGQLSELTKSGMRTFFEQQLGNYLRPFVGAYDSQQERYILYGLQQGAISWSARNQKWVSKHLAEPSHAVTTQRRVLLELPGEGGNLQVLGTGFDYLLCNLTGVGNIPPDESKTFDTVELHSSKPPSEVQQRTETQSTGMRPTELLTTYGQEPLPTIALVRAVNQQYQYPVGRDIYTGESGRLKGKWMQALNQWSASATPTLIRQLTLLFRKSIR